MKLFGYEISDKHIDEPVELDDTSRPVFRKAGNIGCVLFHGIGGTPANVRVLTDELSGRGYSVYAPFIAGHGTTVRDFGNSSWEEWLESAMDACDLLLKEGCTEIIPIGLSLGGIIAGEVAALRKCPAAVLLCAPLKMKLFLRISKELSSLFPYAWYGPEDRHDRDCWQYSRMLNGIATKKLRDLDTLAKDLTGRLKDIRCPVLAVWAGKDNKVDARSREILRKGLTDGSPLTEIVLDESPHGCTYSPEREKVAKIVADYIDSVTKSAKECEEE